MSQPAVPQTTFASGRYSKRKRTQVNYRMEELDVDETDPESEEDVVKAKVRRLCLVRTSDTDLTSEATQDCSVEASSYAQNIPLSPAAGRNSQHDLLLRAYRSNWRQIRRSAAQQTSLRGTCLEPDFQSGCRQCMVPVKQDQ